MKYEFKNISRCNMCGAPSHTAKVLGKRMNQSQGKNPRTKQGISTTILKCKKCDLIYANPLPVPESLDQHYGIPAEDYWTPSYFVYDESYFKRQIDTFFRLYGQEASGLKVLDIGAGIGKAMISLKNRGFEVKGIEPSKPFYDKALERMKISPDDLLNESIESARFPSEYFDFITFGAVLEHLYDASESIKTAMGWLKPGGLLHIEVPSSNWLIAKIANLYYRIWGLDYVTNLSPMHEPFHIYEFGLKSFAENAKINHYEVAYHQFDVCDTFMPKLLNKIIVPYMQSTHTGMQLEIWLRKK